MVLVVLCVVPGDGGKAIYQVSRVHVHLHPMVPMDWLTRVAQGTTVFHCPHMTTLEPTLRSPSVPTLPHTGK